MPRRKGQGISPTKRVPNVSTRDNGLQSRKRPNDISEDVGVGSSKLPTPEMERVQTTADDSSDHHNSKYLHKKFKKMATTTESPPQSSATTNETVANGGDNIDPVPTIKVTNNSKEVEESVSPASVGAILPSQGRYVCPYCKLACAKPSVLQKHIRAHTNERPYPCNPCGFAFKTKSNLYKHCRSRAHALKMEEHGAKFSYPLEETSDIDEEEDENNSNNTPPPSIASTTMPDLVPVSNATVGVEATEKRTIYKPKFHKAAIYHEEEEKVGSICLKIPTPSIPLPKTPASPSSEFLQRHISKIISENQAIVETMDLWPKKPSRQKEKEGSPASPLSGNTSPGLEHAVWPKKFLHRPMPSVESDEERMKAHNAAQSKLALALLRPNVTNSPPSPYNQQPLNLTTNHSRDDAAYFHRKRSMSEGFGSILTKQATAPKDPVRMHNSKNRADEVIAEGFPKNMDKYYHPQNPEGSIIKDLLLKARAGLTSQGFQDIVDGEFASFSSNLQSQEEYLISQTAQYICPVCRISYCNAENLEIHQMYYCKGENFAPSPQHSPSARPPHEELSYSKSKVAKGKAKLDLKISPIKDGSKICQPFPSPGPLLGNTPLVESYYYGKKDAEDEFPRLHKKSRLDSETSSRSSPGSLHESREFAPLSGSGATTLRSLEELSKCPMRPNSLQMFGGEVSIVDGAGETKTMRIEPRGKSPGASEYISLPSSHPTKTEEVSASNGSPQIVVTIARSGLNSGGTIVQVPLKANASTMSVKPPRTSGGSVNSPSPMAVSPLQRTPRLSLSSPPTASYSMQGTTTIANSYPETPKLMPNITTPNLAVPGIPAPNLSHHLPFLPFTSILPDGTLLNPLSNITAFNPLTLPPHSGMLTNVFLSPKEMDNGSGVVTILHGGKIIPYVQGMPGPQSLLATGPNLSTRRNVSPKPLDLASPLKDQDLQSQNARQQQQQQQHMHFTKNKLLKSSNYTTTSTVIQSSHRKMPPKEMSSLKVPVAKPSSVTASLPQGQKHVMTIPSIKVDSVSSPCDSGQEDVPKTSAKVITVKMSDMPPLEPIVNDVNEVIDNEEAKSRAKFLRPTSLPLKPGTFVPKPNHGMSTGMSLVSPETPRPKKSYGQLYLNGHSYTYLALKCSTRPFYCTLNRPQPMYVPLSPEHSKISMYSNWKVCSEADPNPLGLDPGKAMAFYDSRHRPTIYTVARPASSMALTLTHSSGWSAKSGGMGVGEQDERTSEQSVTDNPENLASGEPAPKRVKIFDGGFESNEDYIYVRGRGRGRYVCEECGIRCKKPSMLKKHIRTHTDVRPFTCKHCNFSFKTKGNLTKHMKSKAHYKKCVELGIVPVPTVVDDSYIDEESLARQQALRASRNDNGDSDSDENEDDEDEDDEDEDEDDDLADEEARLEREAACSLLSLSDSTRFITNHRYLCLGLVPSPSIMSRPTTYPYVLTYAAPKPNQPPAEPQTPTLTNLTAQTEREKVMRNSGLALELRDDPTADGMAHGSSASASLPPTGEKNRCYFPSRRTPTLARSESWSEDDISERYSDDSDSERDKSEKSYKSNSDEKEGKSGETPMDLSNKSVNAKVILQPTTPISDILTPVAEPAVLASLCSSMDRFPTPQILPANVKETTMLQAYLTEKALQDVRVKQHQRRHNHGYAVAQSPMQAKEVWLRQMEEDKKDKVTNKNPHFEPKPNQILVSILKVPKESAVNIDRASLSERSKDTSYRDLERDSGHGAGVDQYNGDVQEMTADLPRESSRSDLEELSPPENMEIRAEKMACVSIATSMVRNVVVGGSAFTNNSPTSSNNHAVGRPKAEFLPPSAGGTASYCSVMEDGRSICVICNKIFSKPSQLRLHVNIHYFERPFRCESCAVSFRTKGHLQKHERSVSHQNKVSMNTTFGTATMANPRPFKCDDCKIAFRIHGHLAKHLRSKMHIMKLECVGKLPFGTYAEMEREGVSLNDIDTSDCDNSLESLQVLAQKLYEKDPSKLGQWDGERGELLNPNPPISGGETSSDEGEPCPSPPPPTVRQYMEPAARFRGSAKEDPVAIPVVPPRSRPEAPTERRGGKRKSVEDLDYTDTSDGDNEVNATGKYSCSVCLATFSTVASLHVHSFVEHDSVGDDKTSSPGPRVKRLTSGSGDVDNRQLGDIDDKVKPPLRDDTSQ